MLKRFVRLAQVNLLVLFAAPALATTIIVTTNQDIVNSTDGLCSLREAITAVNVGNYSGNVTGECKAGDANADTIIVPASTYTLTIVGVDEDINATGDLDIRADMTIHGAGLGSTIIDASGFGQTPDRVFDLPVSAISVTLRGLAIENGHAPDGTPTNGGNGEDGGGIRTAAASVTLLDAAVINNQAGAPNTTTFIGNSGNGGGIAARGIQLTLVRSLIANNSVVSGAAGGDFGGGIFATNASVVINSSRIDGNTVGSGSGGGIFITNTAVLQISQSSVTRNIAAFGGGIYAADPIRITNSTIAQNMATINGAGIYMLQAGADVEFSTITANYGDGAYLDAGNSPSIIYRNTVLSGNNGTDCVVTSSGTITSYGYNLRGSGCADNGQSSDIATATPLLGPLALDSNGLTYVMLPYPTSPATNAGNCAASSLFTDQRNHARPADVPRVNNKYDGCDIGAVELDDDIFWTGFDNE